MGAKIDICDIVKICDREIVGKVKLQKMVYLLSQAGYEFDFAFEYHHYGPYSKQLAQLVEDYVAVGLLDADNQRRRTDGVPYVVYRVPPVDKSESKSDACAEQIVKRMNMCSSTVLELAATIHWLSHVEKCRNWDEELRARKGVKTADGRKEKALDLLRSLKLTPAH